MTLFRPRADKRRIESMRLRMSRLAQVNLIFDSYHLHFVSTLEIHRNIMNNDKMQENIQVWKTRRLIKSLDSAKGYAMCLSRTPVTDPIRLI